MTTEDDPYEFRRRLHNEERNRLNATKKELSDVTRIMISNVENVIQRGEAINTLESRASDLSSLSRKYREDANRLNKRSAVFKLFVAISIASLIFLFARFFLF